MMMDSRKVYDCIIIGGGISGLSFAHYLKKDKQEVLVLEKEGKIGGQITTQRFEDTDFWSELGAHTCYNSYCNLLEIVKDLEFEDCVQATSKLSYVIHARDKIKGILSQISLLPIAFNFFRIFFSKKSGKTVKGFFEPIVGKSNYNPLFSNLFRAVISQNADSYPADIFLKKRAVRLDDFPRKYTFREGLQSFLSTIVEKNKIPINLDTSVQSISFTDGVFIVNTETTHYYTRNIAIASDVSTASQLTRTIHPVASEYLSNIALSKSESLNIITKSESLNIRRIAGIIPRDNDFTSVVSRDTVDNIRYRGMTFHFEENAKTKEEKVDIVCKVLGIKKEDILSKSPIEHILPSLRLNDVDLVTRIDNVSKNNVYMLGNYYYGLSLEDCVYRSRIEYDRYKEQVIK